MRLLDTKSLELRFFHGATPSYAILSHTWVDGEEVTFEDYGTLAAKEKLGYQKIVQCCARARTDGYQYAWIDTCCIDKRSSSELSEAINSMFRWYKNAAVCYAWLPDVSASESSNLLHDPYQMSEFSGSRWFTRAWTLQELLAPSDVVFVAGPDWITIGTKATLKSAISSITGISIEVLSNSDEVFKASIAQKFSWASRRHATRTEDIAYCLLGIMNVSLPLLYGEGHDAFVRLQMELLRVTNEHTIFAWMQTSSPSDWDWQQDLGLLATSPMAFKDCADVMPTREFNAAPHTITNMGLSITLPTVRSSLGLVNVLVAYLNCTSARYGRVCLYLHRRGEMHFYRLGRGLAEPGRKWAQSTSLYIDLTSWSSGMHSLARRPTIFDQLHESRNLYRQNRPFVGHNADVEPHLEPFEISSWATGTQRRSRAVTLSSYIRRSPSFALAVARYSWLVMSRNNVHILLPTVPLGILAGVLNFSASKVFALNLLAMVPLATLIADSSAELPDQLGPKVGGLLEEIFANVVAIIVSRRILEA